MSELVVRVPVNVIQRENLRSFRMPCPLSCAQLPSSVCRTSHFAHHLASYAKFRKYKRWRSLRSDERCAPLDPRPCSSADPEYCYTEHLRTIIDKAISDTASRAADKSVSFCNQEPIRTIVWTVSNTATAHHRR